MRLDDYQSDARQFALYPLSGAVVYPTLGLCGESGEVAEKVKKSIRGDKKLNTEELAKELGDVLWYLANLASDLGLDLSTIATTNLHKLASRRDRGVLQGDGDNR